MADRRRRPLTASAMVIAPRGVPASMRSLFDVQDWQRKAWEFYDEVGELRFGANWVANALSKVRLVASAPPLSPGDTPSPLTEGPAVDLLAALGGGVLGQSQMMAEFGRQLTVAGISWLVGQSTERDPWTVRSGDEVRLQGGTVQVLGDDGVTWVDLTEDDLTVKVWTAHARMRHLPDAPTRACLPALRQLKLCDQHIDASAVSRLAGAGILVVPTEAQFPKSNPDSDEDDLVPEMIDAFTTPIGDRSSAAAVVPFVVRVPAQYATAVHHIPLDTPFDERVLDLRDAAIRRLALGMDMPPETLMGVGDVNHWSAWAIQDEAIALHIEPLAEAICNGLNIGYMRPALEAAGLDPNSAMIWYDTVDLRTPPDKTTTALSLHGAGVITDEVLLRETGFDLADMPSPDEKVKSLAARLIAQAPSLLQVAPFLATLAGLPEPEASAATAPELATEGNPVPAPEVPAPNGPPPNPASAGDAQVASAMLAVADLHVTRALERAGSRLRSSVTRGKPQSITAAVKAADNAEVHTVIQNATEFASLDTLLAGAWDNVQRSCLMLDISTEALTATLDRYTRALIASGTRHDLRRLAAAMGEPMPDGTVSGH